MLAACRNNLAPPCPPRVLFVEHVPVQSTLQNPSEGPSHRPPLVPLVGSPLVLVTLPRVLASTPSVVAPRPAAVHRDSGPRRAMSSTTFLCRLPSPPKMEQSLWRLLEQGRHTLIMH